MNGGFSIVADPWIVPHDGAGVADQTTALVKIAIGDRIATRVDDRWSRSARDQVLVSAYPLAMWFAASWWRLLWEPPPVPRPAASLDWRMTHETAAVGHGFIWPRIRFASDGETVEITSKPSAHDDTEPIRFIEDAQAIVPIETVEAAIEEFVTLVVRRVRVMGSIDSQLSKLWECVQEERTDPVTADSRRIEARLGFDPDEAPEALVEGFRALRPVAGGDSAEEIAAGLGQRDRPGDALEAIVRVGQSGGVRGQLRPITGLRVDANRPPWERGRLLAAGVRNALAIDGGIVPNDAIADLLGTSSRYVKEGQPEALPIGLVMRESGSALRLALRKRHPEARRFEAARLIGDALVAPPSERWLPATDAHTARQKVQRSFAAEFLSPIGSLQERLQGDFSDDAVEDAAAFFGVSPLLVRSQLANNGLISPESVWLL